MQTNQHSGRQEAAPVQPAHDPAVQPAHDPYYRPPPGPGGYAYNRRPPPDWEAGRAPGGYYPPDAAGYQPSERAMAQEYRTAEGVCGSADTSRHTTCHASMPLLLWLPAFDAWLVTATQNVRHARRVVDSRKDLLCVCPAH